ncbi:tRNA-queuosine alpha-mannosyltransferase domain-containing protein [Aliikangiella coralliicola]|uniref:tRNA-queuosine alpha-mannosyltransferase n=1 Tax=Aliikangiella coralliicola TaxID=2592383 RepID=A0A545UB40_9GAMM|nr:DUF3524 domain-containing protein [Aliikangiella coralliicola]TQV86680.1 DUF3524 domain-containing protein [Aliikangiella coralliicola]
MKKRILLLSGYDAASHRYWRRTLENNLSEFEWTQLSLPDRHFSWRTRGSSLTFAFERQQELSGDYDLLIATSMVDLAALRGFLPHLGLLPTIVYFHENQFVYPISKEQPNLLNAQLTSIYSALCADQILFNSNYNRNTFLNGAAKLLQRMPDGAPASLIHTLKNKCDVIAVPLEDCIGNSTNDSQKREQPETTERTKIIAPAKILWNHRWEYDKQPEIFFDALLLLKKAGYSFKLNVVGQSFRTIPSCFQLAKEQLASHIEYWGHQPRETYQLILQSSDLVVSTASHDFQGLSMLEAIHAGCTPVAPDSLVYPEYIPESLRYATAQTPQQETANLLALLTQILAADERQPISVNNYLVSHLIPEYRAIFNRLIAR